MKKILFIAGMPGTGKSSILKKFVASHEWETREPVKLVNTMYNEKLNLEIIGKYQDPDAVFPGSDLLSMAVQPQAQKFVSETNSNILIEGDRLFTGSFVEHLFSLDADVGIFILETADEERQRRYDLRGSNQPDKFIEGRRTKVANIQKNFGYTGKIASFNNDNESEAAQVISAVDSFFAGNFTFTKSTSSLDDFFA